MKSVEWAKRETDLLSLEFMEDQSDCDAAFSAYKEVIKILKSKKTTKVAELLLRRLMDGDILSPIEDVDECWAFSERFDPSHDCENQGYTIYRCKRRDSLYKKVIYDRKTGKIENVRFTDTDRAYCMDVNTEKTHTNAFVIGILDEMYPIVMPYYPTGKIRIFTEEFKAYKDSDCSDTLGILYFRFEDGAMEKVMRFFKKDPQTEQMVEIEKSEYFYRKERFEKEG